MTFHFMTGLWLEDMGLEITESIVDHRHRRRMPRRRAAPALREGLSDADRSRPALADRRHASISTRRACSTAFCACPTAATIRAWGSVMIPICVVSDGDGPTALLDRRATTATNMKGRSPCSTSRAARPPTRVTGRVIIVPAHELSGLPGRRRAPRRSTRAISTAAFPAARTAR